MQLKVGTPVKVVYHSKLTPTVDENVTYTGLIHPRQKWQGDDQINLTTGDDRWPWRILTVKNIVSMTTEGVEVELPLNATKNDRSWEVVGSKGNIYIVSEINGHRSCTCPGFGFYGACKHLKMVK